MYKKEYELAKAWISAKNNLELKMEVLEELIAKCTDEAKAAKAIFSIGFTHFFLYN